MRRGVGDIQEERFCLVAVDELGRVPGKEIGGIPRVVRERPVPPPVEILESVRGNVRVVVDRPADKSMKLVEPVVHGVKCPIVAQVPLPDEDGAVARMLEENRDGGFLRGNAPSPSLLHVVPSLPRNAGERSESSTQRQRCW